MGAPPKNKNHLRHGLTTGTLPRGCSYVVRSTNMLRCEIEKAVLAMKGEIGIVDASHVNTACRFERHAMLAQRWLRTEYDNLSAADRLSYSAAIAKASESRDRCIAALGLDADGPGSDPWAALDAQRQRDALTAPAVGDKTPAPLATTPSPPNENRDTKHPNEPNGQQGANTEPAGGNTP